MDPHFTNEIHNSARKYYRLACLRDKEVVIHLSKEQLCFCPIYKFTSVDGLYVAHVGQIQKELTGVKRFYSFLRHTVKLDSRENHLPNIVALKAVAHKVELNYVDPLKEFLNVVYDKDNEEFTEIFVETDSLISIDSIPTTVRSATYPPGRPSEPFDSAPNESYPNENLSPNVINPVKRKESLPW
ncbi:1067_t:CDS:2 [Racocetra fulgida]|uniref:1067_t:CDS:1 n=1 Tax=Racocetra fulgida TaxID=60492 RepID=A0A9N9FN66_9GLOM|nr:1067_t:CDS:2 [Racocetra fulgida]